MSKFTAFILDIDRDPADPYVVAVEANSAANLYDQIVLQWAVDKLGAGLSLDRANGAWNECGAALMGVLPGEHQVFWSVDGISEADLFAHGFTYDKEPETAAELRERVEALPLAEKFPPPFDRYYRSPLDAGDEWSEDEGEIWNRAIKFVRRALKGGKS